MNIKNTKIQFVLPLLATSALLQAANPQLKPNVILLIADDLGSGDVSSLFRKVVKTPNIDRLAAMGVTFSSGYAAVPLSGPSRAACYTGRYPQSFGFTINSGGIPADMPLLQGELKKAGYYTSFLGKWHSKGPMPFKRGCFDETLCSPVSNPFIDYFHPKLSRNGKVEEFNEYSTDLFTREAEEFIDRNKDKPFALTVAYNAPHILATTGNAFAIADEYEQKVANGKPTNIKKIPTARPGDIEKYASALLPDSARADAVACIVALDQGVGRILDKLKQTGLDKNTIVIFCGDNGGHPENRSENLPLRDYKWTDFEGGIRIPFFAVYPGVFPAGLDFKHPVCNIDILPTLMALTGTTPPANVDGVDLTPYITGKDKKAPHENLFFSYGNMGAVRQGKWKLVLLNNEKSQLYDLSTDVREKKDLAAKNKKLVDEITGKWSDWAKKNNVKLVGKGGVNIL